MGDVDTDEKEKKKINKFFQFPFYAQSTQNVYKELQFFCSLKTFSQPKESGKIKLMFLTIFALLIVFAWKFLSISHMLARMI